MKFDMVAILPAGGHSGLAERPGINRRRLPEVMTERRMSAYGTKGGDSEVIE